MKYIGHSHNYNIGAAEPIVVPYVKANEKAQPPTQADKLSAGYDLYAVISEPITIKPGETVKISTGLKMAFPVRTFGAIFARSGIATKKGLAPVNGVGVIDSSYRGEIIVALHNYSNEEQTVSPRDRIAQLIVLPYCNISYQVVDELDNTERGEGGFGHSGT